MQLVSWGGVLGCFYFFDFFPFPFLRAALDDFVEDVDDLVDVVDERGVEDDDDDMELGVFGEPTSSCIGVGGVDSLLRDGPGCGVDSLEISWMNSKTMSCLKAVKQVNLVLVLFLAEYRCVV